MKRSLVGGVVSTTLVLLALPFVGGAGPSFLAPAYANEASVDRPVAATGIVGEAAAAPAVTASDLASALRADASRSSLIAVAPPAQADREHVAQKPVPKPLPPVTASGAASGTQERRAGLEAQGLSCPGNVGGTAGGAPGISSGQGVGGTTDSDLTSFAATFNATRVANCLNPIPVANFRYDSCMEARLFWMAEDPSSNPSSAWGHMGSQRSDGVPSVGCDGNLAGGLNNSGATVAVKWWESASHRSSLYKPGYTGNTGGVCIFFAMSHGGVPDEPYSFTRAAARWGTC